MYKIDPYNTEVTEGDVVLLSSQAIGIIRTVLETAQLVGIELTDPLGNSDGKVFCVLGFVWYGCEQGEKNKRKGYNGIVYFHCKPKCGIFVRSNEIVRLITPEELLKKIILLNRQMAQLHQANPNTTSMDNTIQKDSIDVALEQKMTDMQKEVENLQAQVRK
ncbi:hypothetical protein RFI_20563, partial [Reticulomyxa filosa]